MIFIFGDFNAKSSIWGPRDTDKRGEILLDLIIENDLLIVNDSKSLPSYSCPSKGQSWIDLFLLKNVSCDIIISWRIDDRINFSDHNFMDFEFSLEIFKKIPKKKSWKTSDLNWFDFKASISSISDSMENCEMDDVDFFVHKFQNAIVNSCWKNRRKRITIGKNAIWWNPFLEMERSRIRALRRRFQATSEPNERIRRKIYFKRELTKYKRTCIDTKMATFRDHLDKIVVVNTFDSFYCLIDDSFSTSRDLVQMLDDNGQEIDTHSKIMEYILKFLFPTIDDDEILSVQTDKISEFDLITEEEIISIFEDCKKDKSPDPDGLTMGIIKEIFFDNKSLFIKLLNLCLHKGIFPKAWKRGNVALIPKSGKDLRLPNNYRPICLLPVWDKILDKILAQRLS
ncbi:hypothetical protein AVEN_62429-1 [Araneus ventricosus]|uniref:Endonuclease/exonuclease/phosphatase domain-containing protein n=1 Tax=Araneus ventricosus TaxID=182803 RepID=A0A4Y2V3L7_ARAVE|nr:hypothetical protein AVEN_62429-1 [Araneus ventricosus]